MFVQLVKLGLNIYKYNLNAVFFLLDKQMHFMFGVLVVLKVTSKGVGLNPNAKVWQEIPVVSSEVAADATPWSPSDVNDGETCDKTPPIF